MEWSLPSWNCHRGSEKNKIWLGSQTQTPHALKNVKKRATVEITMQEAQERASGASMTKVCDQPVMGDSSAVMTVFSEAAVDDDDAALEDEADSAGVKRPRTPCPSHWFT